MGCKRKLALILCASASLEEASNATTPPGQLQRLAIEANTFAADCKAMCEPNDRYLVRPFRMRAHILTEDLRIHGNCVVGVRSLLS